MPVHIQTHCNVQTAKLQNANSTPLSAVACCTWIGLIMHHVSERKFHKSLDCQMQHETYHTIPQAPFPTGLMGEQIVGHVNTLPHTCTKCLSREGWPNVRDYVRIYIFVYLFPKFSLLARCEQGQRKPRTIRQLLITCRVITTAACRSLVGKKYN